jgi:hypothetical protein
MHPQTVDQEALAAFHRLRALAKANPSIIHSFEEQSPPPASPSPGTTFTANITSVHPDWVLILAGRLSENAYKLGLKSQITFDFTLPLTAVKVTCEGSAEACEAFESKMNWTINYINEKLRGQR